MAPVREERLRRRNSRTLRAARTPSRKEGPSRTGCEIRSQVVGPERLWSTYPPPTLASTRSKLPGRRKACSPARKPHSVSRPRGPGRLPYPRPPRHHHWVRPLRTDRPVSLCPPIGPDSPCPGFRDRPCRRKGLAPEQEQQHAQRVFGPPFGISVGPAPGQGWWGSVLRMRTPFSSHALRDMPDPLPAPTHRGPSSGDRCGRPGRRPSRYGAGRPRSGGPPGHPRRAPLPDRGRPERRCIRSRTAAGS